MSTQVQCACGHIGQVREERILEAPFPPMPMLLLCVPVAEGTGLEPATLYQGTAVPKRPLTIRLPSVVMAGLEPAAT